MEPLNNSVLTPTSKIIELAKKRGVNFGSGTAHERIRYLIKLGLLPNAKKKTAYAEDLKPQMAGHLPLYTVDQLVKIQELQNTGYSLLSISELVNSGKLSLSDISGSEIKPLLQNILAKEDLPKEKLIEHKEVNLTEIHDSKKDIGREELHSHINDTNRTLLLEQDNAKSGKINKPDFKVAKRVFAGVLAGLIVSLFAVSASAWVSSNIINKLINNGQISKINSASQKVLAEATGLDYLEVNTNLLVNGTINGVKNLSGSDNTQTLTNKTLSGTANSFSNIPNSALTNSSITINAVSNIIGGGTVALGGSTTLALTTTPSFSSLALLASSAQIKSQNTSFNLPNPGGVDSLVDIESAQSLTNKNLVSPDFTFGSDASGDIFYRDALGNVARLPIGTTNQVLTVTAGLPSWVTSAIGGAGANTSLSNLSAVAINASLLPGSDNSIDLGDLTHTFRNLYIGTSILGRSGSNINITPSGGATTNFGGNSIILAGINGVPGSVSNGQIFYDTSDNKIKIVESGTVKILCNTTDAVCGNGTSVLLAPSVAQVDASTNTSININKTLVGSLLSLSQQSSVSSPYTTKDNQLTRALTSSTASESVTGSILNIVNSSNLSGAGSLNGGTELLITNPTPTGGTIFSGKFVDFQRADSAGSSLLSKFSVDATGAVIAAGSITTNSTIQGTSATFNSSSNQLTLGSGAGTTGLLTFPVSGGNKTITFPNETGTVCTTGSVCAGYQASLGFTTANNALSNLSAVAINSSLLPGSNNSIDLGDGTHQFRTTYLGTSIILGTSGSNKTTLNFTSPTAANTINFPDSTGTVAISSSTPLHISASGNLTVDNATTSTSGVASFNSTNFTVSSGAVNTIQNINATANPTFASESLTGASPLTLGTASTNTGAVLFKNSTNSNTVTLNSTAITANITYDFADAATGTYDICTTAGNCSAGGAAADVHLDNLSAVAINTSLLPALDNTIDLGDSTHQFRTGFVGTSMVFGTSGSNKITFNFTAPTGNRTITLPDQSGNVCLDTGNCLGGTGGANASLSNLSSVAINTSLLPGANNSIDLGDSTHTFRNAYIGTGITTAASTDLLLDPTTGIVSIKTASATNTLRIYENAASPTNFLGLTNTAITPSVAFTVGTTGQDLTLQGAANTKLVANNGANSTSLNFASISGNATVTIPNTTGTICLQASVSCGFQASGSYANTALSNLASVSINTSLLPASANSIDLGDSTHSFRSAYIGTSITTPSSTNLALKPNTGVVSINTVSQANELRVFENSASPTNFISLTYNTLSGGGTNANIAINPNGTGTTNFGGNSIVLASLSGVPGSVSNGQVFYDTSDNKIKIVENGTVKTLCNTTDAVCSNGTSVLLAPSVAQVDSSTNTAINISKTGIASLLNLSQQSAITSAYTTNDSILGRALTSSTASVGSTGSILNIVNSSSLTGASSTNAPTELLITNPTPTSAALFTGKFVDFQRADSAGGPQVSKFSVDATGNVIAAGNANVTGTVTAASASLTGTSALTLGTASTSTGSTIFKNSTNGNTITLQSGTPTSNRVITLPDAGGTVCTDSGNCLGGGSGGANTSLSNLSSVAINTALLPGSTTIDLGSSGSPFRDINLSDASLSTSNASLGSLTFKNNNTGAGNTINGLTITENAAASPSSGTNTSNLINLTGNSGGIVNAIKFGSNLTNYFTGTNAALNSSGTLSLGSASANTGAVTLFNSANANTATLTSAAVTANVTYNLPDAATGTYDICTSAGNCLGGGGGGANTALSNLSSVAINTSLLPGANNSIDLGNGTHQFRTAYIGTSVILGTSGSNSTTLSFTAPTAARTVTFPDETGTVCTTGSVCSGYQAAGSFANSALSNLASVAINTSLLPSANNSIDLGDGTHQFRTGFFGTSLVFGTSGLNKTTLNFTAPTTSNAITMPNASGTVAISGTSPVSVSATGAISVADATTSTKGIASFNSINLSVSSGAVNTVQDIATSSTPTFASETLTDASSLILGTASTNNGAAIFKNSSNANTATLQASGVSHNVTFNLPDATVGTYDLCTTSGNCLGGSGGANTALSNLSSVAINTSLLPGADNSIDLGNGTHQFRTAYIGTSLILGTSASNSTTLNFTSPTAARTITFPNESGTLCTTGSVCSGYQAAGSFANTALSNLASVAINTSLLPATDNAIDLGNGTHQFRSGYVGNSLIFGTNASNNTTLDFVSPTAANTIHIPNSSGTVAVSGNSPVSVSASGAISVANATTSTTGVASFNSTNFTVSSGVVNTIQNINSTATPTFASQTLTGASSLTLGTALTNIGSILFKNSTNSNTAILSTDAVTAAVTYNLPDAAAGSYDLCTSSGNCLGGSTGGANTALSNLASVAINTSLLPGTDNSIDLGNGTHQFRTGFFGTSLVFGTSGTNKTTLNFTSPTAANTITLPNASGTVAISASSPLSLSGAGAVSITNAKADGTTLGAVTFNSTNFTDNGSGVINTVQNINTTATPTFASETLTGGSSLNLGTSSSNTGAIIFKNSSNTNTATLQSGVTSSSYTLTLPTAQGGVGTFLKNDGSGNLSFVSPSGTGICSDCVFNDGNVTDATNTIKPTGDVTSLSLWQTSNGTPTKNIFGIFDSAGSTAYATLGPDATWTLNSASGKAFSIQQGGSNFVAINTSGAVTVSSLGTNQNLTLSSSGAGNVNISNGALQTGGTTRLSNAGALSNVTGYTQSSGTFSQTSTNNSSTDTFASTNNSMATSGQNLANFTFKNNNTGAGLSVNGITITESAAATPSSGTNTSNLVNLSAGSGGTVNGINFGSNLTNYFTATNASLTSSGGLALGSASTNNGTITFSNSTNANTAILQGANVAHNVTYNLPDNLAGTYDLCTTSGNCLGGAGGANTALSNLASVAINTSLLPGNTSVDLGSSGSPFRNLNLSDTSLSTNNSALASVNFKNNNTGAGNTINGINVTENGAATPASGTNTSNLINLSGNSGGTINGINFGSNLTNYFTGTNSTLTAAGALTLNSTLSATNGTFTGANSLTLGTGSTNTGAIIYRNSTNSNTVTIQSGTTSGSYTLTLPTAQASGTQILQNDGSGNLSWATAGTCPDCVLNDSAVTDGTNTIVPTNDVTSLTLRQASTGSPTKNIFAITNSGNTANYAVLSSSAAWTLSPATNQNLSLSLPAGTGSIVASRANTTSNSELVDFQSSALTQTISGAVTNDRFNQFLAPTITAATSQTVTNASTLYIDQPPIASGSATITNAYSLAFGNAAAQSIGILASSGSTAGKGLSISAGTGGSSSSGGGDVTITGGANGGGTNNGNLILQNVTSGQNGFIGIGTSSPIYTVDLVKSSTSSSFGSAGFPEMRIRNTSTATSSIAALDLSANDTSVVGHLLADGLGNVACTTNTISVALCTETNTPLIFGTNNAKAMTILGNGKVGINVASPNTNLEIGGALRLSTTTTDTFTTPAGSSVGTKINIPIYDPGSFGQIVAMGIGSGGASSARVISLFDQRASSHQPTLAVFSPDENQVGGLSYEGGNTYMFLKSTVGLKLATGGSSTTALAISSSDQSAVFTPQNTSGSSVVITGLTQGGDALNVTDNSLTNGGTGEHIVFTNNITGAAGTSNGLQIDEQAAATPSSGTNVSNLLHLGANSGGTVNGIDFYTANFSNLISYDTGLSNPTNYFSADNFVVTGAGAATLSGSSTLTLGKGSTNTGSETYKNSTNNNTVTIQSGATSSSYTLTLPTAQAAAANYVLTNNGSGALSWQSVSGVGGANSSLSNLSSVAINTTLLPGSDATIDLGASATRFRNLYLSGTLIGQGNAEYLDSINNGYGGIGIWENELTFSEQLDNAAWTATNVNVTADSTQAPDNLTTAETLADSSSGGNVKQTGNIATASKTFAGSIWLKTNTGTQSVDLRIDSGNQTGTASTITATTTWQRFSVTQSFTSGSTGNAIFLIFPGGTGGSGSVRAWGAQLENITGRLFANAGAYIRTTTSTISQSSGVVSNGGLTSVANTATDVPGMIYAAPSQTGNLLEFRNSTGTTLANFTSAGSLTLAGASPTISATNASTFTINGPASQTFNIQQNGSNFLSINSSGATTLTSLGTNQTLALSSAGTGAITLTSAATTANASTLTADSVTSGTGLAMSVAGLTTGNGFTITSNSAALTSGILESLNHTATYTTTSNDSGNVLNLNRNLTVNGTSQTLTVSGALLGITSNCTQTVGTCTDTSNLISLTQSYVNASGAVLTLSNSGTGTGLNISNGTGSALAASSTTASGTGTSFTFNSLTSGTGLNISSSSAITGALANFNASALTTGTNIAVHADAITTGTGVAITSTSTVLSSAKLLNLDHTATYTTTVTDSGNLLNANRALTTNTGGALTISGSLASLTSNCTQTAGTCTDTSNILSLTQSYASASGTMLTLSNSGTGNGINITNGTGSALTASGTTASGTGASFTFNSLTSGTALSISSSGTITGTVLGLTANSLTTGTGESISLNGLTTGKGINLTSSSAVASSGIFEQITHNGTYTTTVTDSGNLLNLSRSLTTNTGGALTISGALAALSSTCTQTAGTCTDTSNILSLTQSYASASGTTLTLSNSGTGNGINITNGTAGALTASSTNATGTSTTAAGSSFTFNSLTSGIGLLIQSTNAITGNGKLVSLSDNSLTTGTMLDLSATGLTSGKGLNITLGGTATDKLNGGTVLNISAASNADIGVKPTSGNTTILSNMRLSDDNTSTNAAPVVIGQAISVTLNTSGTAGGDDVIGQQINMLANQCSSTCAFEGQEINWDWTSNSTNVGLQIEQKSGDTMPTSGITQYGIRLASNGGATLTAGAGTLDQIHIDNTGFNTTTGTVLSGINITGNNSQSAGTQYGIKINNLTAGASTEEAINIGSGWDNAVNINSGKLTIKPSGVISVDLANTATTNGLCHSGANVDTGTDTTRDVVACSGAPADVAEWYETTGNEQPGDVVAVSNQNFTYQETQSDPFTGEILPGKVTRTISKVQKSTSGYQKNVLGVVSTSPYQVFGSDIRDQGIHPEPIALSGRVPVKVSVENGSIASGDYLTASATKPGYAMRATQAGEAIGLALASSSSDGEVLVFVKPTWFDPNAPVYSSNGTPSGTQGTSQDPTFNSVTATTATFNTLNIGTVKLTADSSGNLKVGGNLLVAGNFTVQKDITLYGALRAPNGLAVRLGSGKSFTVNDSQNDQLTVNQNGASVSQLNISQDSQTPTNNSVGTLTLNSGQKKVAVNTNKIKTGSHVIVTFGGDYSPATRYWVDGIADGKSFDLNLDQPVGQNVTVNWWIVN